MLGWCAVGAVMLSAASAEAAPASTGTVFGGFTAKDFPVVVETSKSGRRVVRMGVGVELSCTSGVMLGIPARDENLKISRTGRFTRKLSFTNRNGDGTTTDFESSLAGAFNRARTRVTGTWSTTMTFRDAAGAVTDTCESSSVRWSAKQ